MKKLLNLLLLTLTASATMNATVSKPVPTCTTTIQTGQTYYLYNAATDLFVNRGENWYTRLCAGNFGMPFTLQTSAGNGAYYNIVSQKGGSGVYWNASDQWNAYYDGEEDKSQTRFSIEAVPGETYFHLHTEASPSDYALVVQPSWSDRALQSWTDGESANCRWCFVTEADYEAYLLALDAYASVSGINLSQSICRKGVTDNFPEQTEEIYSAQNGYICNGFAKKVDGKLQITPRWDNVHLMEELPYMPSGRYTLRVNASINDNQWCDGFMMATSTAWNKDNGDDLAKDGLNTDITFNYDNTQGDLRVGLRSWNVDSWAEQNIGLFTCTLSGISLTYKGSGQHTLTVGTSGYATLFLPYATTIPSGVEAFTGEIIGDCLSLTKLDNGVIPAETAVVLQAAAGTYTFVQTEAAAFSGTNDLKGDISKTEQDAQYTYFALSSSFGDTGFYKINQDVPVPAFKAYITIPAGSDIKAFRFEEDEATGINDLKDSKDANDAIYNLSGQQIVKGQLTKGLYILNGKKVVKK